MLHLWFSFYTGRAFVQVLLPQSAKMLPCVQWHFNLTVLRPGKWGWEPGLSAEAMESSELLCTFPLGISDSCWWFWTVYFSVFHLQGEEHSLLTKICWFWNSERDLFFFFPWVFTAGECPLTFRKARQEWDLDGEKLCVWKNSSFMARCSHKILCKFEMCNIKRSTNYSYAVL